MQNSCHAGGRWGAWVGMVLYVLMYIYLLKMLWIGVCSFPSLYQSVCFAKNVEINIQIEQGFRWDLKCIFYSVIYFILCPCQQWLSACCYGRPAVWLLLYTHSLHKEPFSVPWQHVLWSQCLWYDVSIW